MVVPAVAADREDEECGAMALSSYSSSRSLIEERRRTRRRTSSWKSSILSVKGGGPPPMAKTPAAGCRLYPSASSEVENERRRSVSLYSLHVSKAPRAAR